MADMIRREPISDADYASLDQALCGMSVDRIDEVCPDCNFRLIYLTFLYRDDRPLDDRMYKLCPVCSGHRLRMGEMFALVPELLANEQGIAAAEECYGPRREWIGPFLN